MLRRPVESAQYAIVRDIARDWPGVIARTRTWTGKNYGGWLDEWLYSHARPGLIVEPFIGTGDEPPNDYKVYVFGGSAEVVQVHTGRMSDHRWVQYDPRWNRLSNGEDCPPPVGLDAMIVAAEALGQGHDFVRVDFYGSRPAVVRRILSLPGIGARPVRPGRA